MKKPMLGIAAVCLMQLVFVAYNAIDRPVDRSAVKPIREDFLTPMLIDDGRDKIVVYRSGSIVDTTKTEKRRPAKWIAAEKAASHPIAPRLRSVRPSAILARRENRIEDPEGASRSPETERTDAAQHSRLDRRSFFAKTVSVVKKPYDWTKAAFGKFY